MGRPTRSATSTVKFPCKLKFTSATTLAKSILEDSFTDLDGHTGRLLESLCQKIIEERKKYLKTGKWR